MASRGKKSGAYQALQALMALPGSHNDIWTDLTAKLFDDPMDRMGRFLAATPEYDDRAAAIVFGALVEHSLEAALTTYFDIEADNASKLFTYSEDEGRISTFSAKIALGAALGVYDHRMRHDLTWVKNIQNAFAHARVYVDFKTEAIILACDQLRFPAKRKPEDSPPVAKVAVTPRQRYTAAAGTLAAYLRMPQKRLRFTNPKAAPVYETLYGPLPSSLETPH
jgi:hypothetical protein